MGHLLKVFRNNKNNQLFVPLSRKLLDLKGKDVEAIRLKKEDIILRIKKKRGMI